MDLFFSGKWRSFGGLPNQEIERGGKGGAETRTQPSKAFFSSFLESWHQEVFPLIGPPPTFPHISEWKHHRRRRRKTFCQKETSPENVDSRSSALRVWNTGRNQTFLYYESVCWKAPSFYILSRRHYAQRKGGILFLEQTTVQARGRLPYVIKSYDIRRMTVWSLLWLV